MGYLTTLAIVFVAIWCCFFLLLFHYGVFALIGVFQRKTYPKADRLLKYGVVIAARNEEAVIGPLLDSIRANDYPQEKLAVFVIAHNCTDRTAQIARAHGANVYEYNNPAERTAGYAYRCLFDRINAEGAGAGLDGFFIINADNVLAPDYISKMNDAFVATGGECVITSYRNSRNFGSNYMSCLYGIYFLSACRFEARGRTVCGCSTRVSGTGYLFHPRLVEHGWEYVTLTEDWEFTADQLARGSKVLYCDEAEFFDEQPLTVKVMLRQRLRWARGHMIVFFTRFRELMKSLFSRENKLDGRGRFSVFDISASILPLGVISVSLLLVQLGCVALCPLFGYDPGRVWRIYGLISLALFALSYGLTMLGAVLLIFLERARIRNVGAGKLAAAVALWPLFLLVNVFLDVAALFLRDLEWKVIPHVGAPDSERVRRRSVCERDPNKTMI